MDENLVGYLMQALDSPTQQQVEKHLQESPEARQQLETLKKALEPLECDKDSIDPPPLLAYRSLARVAEYRCQPLTSAPEVAPAAETVTGGAPPWWRRADVLVAAGLFIAIFGVGLSGVDWFRAYKQRVDCASNLQQFHQMFTSYADQHGQYPGFDLPAPHNVAGMYVPVLNDAGFDASKLTNRCAGAAGSTLAKPSVEGMRLLSDEAFAEAAPKLSSCYAYSLGYHDPVTGQRMALRRSQPGEVDNDQIPVMADRPSAHNDHRGNSPNHAGGQNVLHVGGHVRFLTSPMIEGDDIYRNKHGKVAAGVDRFDTVLGASGDRP